jgi:DnaJ-class molecular chaperone
MTFGKRLPMPSERAIQLVQETCVRCYGTGYVRERGDRLRCQTCAASGRIVAKVEAETEADAESRSIPS